MCKTVVKSFNWLPIIHRGLEFKLALSWSRREFNLFIVSGEFKNWFITEDGIWIKSGTGGCEGIEERSNGADEVFGKVLLHGFKLFWKNSWIWDELVKKFNKNFCSSTSRSNLGDKLIGLIGSKVEFSAEEGNSEEGGTDARSRRGDGMTGTLFVKAVHSAETDVSGNATSDGGIEFWLWSGDETNDAAIFWLLFIFIGWLRSAEDLSVTDEAGGIESGIVEVEISCIPNELLLDCIEFTLDVVVGWVENSIDWPDSLDKFGNWLKVVGGTDWMLNGGLFAAINEFNGEKEDSRDLTGFELDCEFSKFFNNSVLSVDLSYEGKTNGFIKIGGACVEK